MQKILTEWRKYLAEQDAVGLPAGEEDPGFYDEPWGATYKKNVDSLNAWIRAGGEVPDSVHTANPKQKEAIELAKKLSAGYKEYGKMLTPELITTINKLIRATKAMSPEEMAQRPSDFPISNMFAAISRNVHKKTGVRILDPTASKTMPEWAKCDPGQATCKGRTAWAAAQTTADIFAQDPFTAAIMFIPIGKLGTAGVKALETAGVKGAARLGAMPVGEAIVKYAPEKAAKVFQALNTAEVKIVARDFNKELGKAMNQRRAQNVAYSGAPWADDLLIATRATLRKAAGGELSSWARVVQESAIGGKMYSVHGRQFVVLDTQYGPVSFYRSLGKSTKKLKKLGEWHLFSGFAAHSNSNYVTLMKTPWSINLAKGGDKYLTRLSLALEEAETQGLLGRLKFTDLTTIADQHILTINQKIAQMNKAAGFEKYMYYDSELMAEAYGNKILQNAGSLEGNLGRGKIAPGVQNEYAGLNNIRSERVSNRPYQSGGKLHDNITVRNKILPSLESVLAL